MSVYRKAAQRDLNEPEIVDALRAAGCVVYLMPKPVDLLVGYGGRTFLLEVKRDRSTKEGGRHGLTDDQKAFVALWSQGGGPVEVVRTPAEALLAVGVKP